MGDPKSRLSIVVALLVGLGAGYFAGREHLKYEMKTALKNAFEGVSEKMKGGFADLTTEPAENGDLAAKPEREDPEPASMPTRVPLPTPREPAPQPQERRPSPVTVKLLDKEFIPTNLEIQPPRFQERIDFVLLFTSTLNRDLRAFTGTVVFNDLFDRTIMRVGITVEDALTADGTVRWAGGIDYNQFMDHHRTLRNKEAKDLNAVFELESVIYADGTREDFKKR